MAKGEITNHPKQNDTETGGGMIDQVIRFSNEIVMVFDEKGEQIPEFQGRYEEVRAGILAHAPKSAKFFHGIWNISANALPRKEW